MLRLLKYVVGSNNPRRTKVGSFKSFMEFYGRNCYDARAYFPTKYI